MKCVFKKDLPGSILFFSVEKERQTILVHHCLLTRRRNATQRCLGVVRSCIAETVARSRTGATLPEKPTHAWTTVGVLAWCVSIPLTICRTAAHRTEGAKAVAMPTQTPTTPFASALCVVFHLLLKMFSTFLFNSKIQINSLKIFSF